MWEKTTDFGSATEVTEDSSVCVVKLCHGVETDTCAITDCKIGNVCPICACIAAEDDVAENH